MKITILFKSAASIVILGLFLITVFIAVSYENLSADLYVILIFVITFVFLFGFAIGQRIVSPIKKLVEKATSLAEGILTTRVYFKTKDEFEQLAEILNKIAVEMEKNQNTAQKAEDIAEVTIRAKTQELEEAMVILEEKIKARTKDLQKIVEESESLRGLVKDRETEITRLRKEIIKLKEKRGTGNR